jgi:hypothetical protein
MVIANIVSAFLRFFLVLLYSVLVLVTLWYPVFDYFPWPSLFLYTFLYGESFTNSAFPRLFTFRFEDVVY